MFARVCYGVFIVLNERPGACRMSVQHPSYAPRLLLAHSLADSYMHVFTEHETVFRVPHPTHTTISLDSVFRLVSI
jgi:hypothetical protein